jgi:osmoprotectant transport system substrate-binding protein
VKRTMRLALGLTIALALAGTAAACGGDDSTAGQTTTTTAATAKPSVTIGAQDFGESAILAEIYKQALEAKGFKASIQKLGGFRDIEVAAFDKHTINFAPEYAASMLEFLNSKKGEATGDVGATVDKLQTYLDAKGLQALDASDAVDTNALVVTRETADRLGLKTLSDLASKGADLKLGGPADCETNPFCIPGLKKTYGVDLAGSFKALETGQVAAALDAKQIDVALLFSTDSRIKSKGYVLLEDDKHLLAADNVVPVVTTALGSNSGLADIVNAVSAKLTTSTLIELNEKYDVEKADASTVAAGFLKDNGLG